MSGELKRGLEGVLVAESKLSFIDGDAGQLVYCGYDIEDLARDASYEEVLYLLWHGALPTGEELDAFSDELAAHRDLDDGVLDVARELAEQDESPMAALRTLVSAMSAYDESADFEDVTDREVNLEKAKRITAKMPSVLAAYARFRRGDDYVEPDESLNHAANFLYMLNGEEPNEVLAETFDMALVLHADHGLNASTFSAMVTSSTLSDLYSAVTSAIGTLSGSLHGGANANVMRMLKDVDDSDMDPTEWVKDALDRGERVAGFGHRVYNVKDPRAKILGAKSEALGEAAGDMKWYEMSVAIEEYIGEEKGLAPNVDFYSASTYYQMGIPIDLYTPIFAVSRAGGWIAHVLEQYEDNRLIRPRARYTGEKDLDFTPVDER
ncbi:citrate synthase [Haloferax volcanii]|uniref:Citrate synthase n=2 Tax=Haloferax volcanii TaxID=2246 RepID=CISY_HALVD|nr:citrate synthase [Haloferax volcanii]D4GS06.1 RecName: Full=Citrate synthase [Haloferax volcanii DS2]ADE03756.1 citrate synthase [Haloferax volcanii DS2]ELY25937.1 citrate synthase [Haloferax volcanii DS2]MBS8118951.1 citrate synthase [Haloferax volcanii]MBS8123965.1 citrate synthase [Haloferax volcanii]MBS8127834.1 citrate synthase [Haloferax volcanii]